MSQSHLPHFPSNPDKFEFDAEVAPIFPVMAKRSIPNYEEAHQLHAEIMAFYFLREGASLIDIGASRGQLFTTLENVYKMHGQTLPWMKMVAVDSSIDMCKMMIKDFPELEVRHQSLLSPEFMNSTEQYNVVNAMYVVQFIPREFQGAVLDKLSSMVKPGGILILGQKEKSDTFLGRILHDEYIDFRVKNGYSRREIESKTKALEQSMWPMDQAAMIDHLTRNEFREIVETTRYTVFSTLIAHK